MPIPAQEFDEGVAVVKKPLSQVMDPALAYTINECQELVGRSWGITKKMLLAAEEEGNAVQKKIGRKIYWKYTGESTFGEEE